MSNPADSTNIAHDLAVVEAMAAEMEPYLKSDLLYWRLSPAAPISPPPPMLTMGGYLLRTHRLAGQRDGLNAEQRAQLEAAETTFQTAIQEWAAHTEKRIERELGARLNSWGWFVDDCQTQKKSCITYYTTEAELRTIIALLMEAAARFGDVTAQGERLQGLDAQFQLWFQPGDFVWRAGLEPTYPRDRFWWLYGRLEFPAG